jgi:gliding motility-associated-like protein
MNKLNLLKFILAFLSGYCLLSGTTKASHIVGGELYYTYLGSDRYRLTLKVYRDCINGIPPFDYPAYIGIYDVTGTILLSTEFLYHPGSIILPAQAIDPCLNVPDNVCVEEAIYQRDIYLPPRIGGYQLAYQRCCRNETILNLIQPDNTGATYYTAIPERTAIFTNSGPRFNHFPPIFICLDQPLVFDHSASDPDGDSLVYSLCEPLKGGSASNPQPAPATPPPYDPVDWAAPYSTTDPLGGIPLSIDPETGLLTGTPNREGQFVVGVCVSEYRNGVLIGVHKRDFQFNVTPCPPKVSASLPANIISCGYTMQFQNNSQGAFSYFWDFGVPHLTNDTSVVFEPSYTYPGVGVYNVQLITNKNQLCTDTAYATITIYNSISGAAVDTPEVCVEYPAAFADRSVLSEGAPVAWRWDFGDGSPVSTLQNPTHLYTAAGVYPVFFTVYNENGCTDTLTIPVSIHPPPVVDAGRDTILCADATVQLFPQGVLPFLWQASPYLSCTNCPNPIVALPPDTSAYFHVSVTDSRACSTSDSVRILVRKRPEVRFVVPPHRCYNTPLSFSGMLSGHSPACGVPAWLWDFGDGHTSQEQNPTHLYDNEGSYTVALKIQNSSTFQETVHLLPPDSCLKNLFVPNAFTPNGDGENDRVYLRAINAIKSEFRIYNRWGEEVFRSQSLEEGWDGVYKGTRQTPQTFVFVAEVTFYDGTEKTLKGNITLLD